MDASVDLLEKLDKYFNESELKELCFEMGIDYENIEGVGKRSKALELIRYVRRYERIDELVQLCQQKRPRLNFASLLVQVAVPEKADLADSTSRRLSIFISHVSQDKPLARQLCHQLRIDGFAPWLDEERILPGQDWDLEIKQAMRASDAILLCFSRLSVAKEGYIQREYKKAMDYQQEKPEGAIFVIPVRLDDCEIPFSIQELQYVDYPAGYVRLLKSLNLRAEKLNLPVATLSANLRST